MMAEMMYIGLDIGIKRMGVAVGSSQTPVFGKGTIDLATQDWREYINKLVVEYHPISFVIGQPEIKSGDETDIVRLVQEWRQVLMSAYDLPVILFNEAYSSVEAQRQLRQEGVDTTQNKKAIDERAAMIILEHYLHSQ